MQDKLKEQIKQTQKNMTNNKEWQETYDKQAEILLNHREILKQFYKKVKDMEHLQFYITDIPIDQPTLFKISIRYYN